MSHLIVLVPAPALGPASWRPVAERLAVAGRDVVVPSLRGFASGAPPYARRLTELAARQVPATPRDSVVLVTHSGAGAFAGQLAAAIGAGETIAVFADAGLPGLDGAGPVVDAQFLPYLSRIARDGIVPPWPQWWPDEDLSPLFPDERTQREVTAEAEALPLAFYEETLPPVSAGWPPARAGYLLFSPGYRPAADRAAALGWPVTEVPGEHLHMLVSPAEVADAIAALAGPG